MSKLQRFVSIGFVLAISHMAMAADATLPSVEKPLEAAKKKYQDALNADKKKILDYLEREEDNVRRNKKLGGQQQLAAVSKLKEATAAIKQRGEYPPTLPPAIEKQVKATRDAIASAYDDAIRKYLADATGKFDARAKALQAELETVQLDLGGLGARMKRMPAPVIVGNWRVDNNQLVVDAAKGRDAHFEFGDPTWTDYNFRLKAQVDELDAAVGVLGHQSAVEPVHFFTAGNKWVFFPFGAWGKLGSQDLIAAVPGEDVWASPARRFLPESQRIEYKKPYAIELKLRGDEITVFFEGKPVAKSKHAKATHGRVGVGCNGYGKVRFWDFEVVSPAGGILWRGLPQMQ